MKKLGRPFTTHCQRGHEFTRLNSIISPDGKKRRCRRCHAVRQRAYNRRKLLADALREAMSL